jgi:TrmH family RNA methyltransferase
MATRQQHRQPTGDDLRQVRRLRRRRARESAGAFVVEGLRGLRHALAAGAGVVEVYTAPELYAGPEEARAVDVARRRGARIVRVGAPAIASVSTQERPEGVVALVAQWPTNLGARLLGPAPLLLVAEGAERPGNLGSIVRAACAAGASGFVSCDGQTDVFHAKAVRASAGGVFHVPVAVATSERTLAWLQRHGVAIVAAAPDGAGAHWSVDLTRPVALVLGSEKRGLARTWLDAAGAVVRIPMPGGGVDSLNVGAAAGILLWEAVRQRAGLGAGG